MKKKEQKIYEAVFFETENGRQPVRDFIKGLAREDQKVVGADIRIVQNNYPVGLPLVRKLKSKLWDVRSEIKDGIVRVFFTVANENIVLLHAIIKKTQKIPPREIDVAIERLKVFNKMNKQGK